MKRFFLWFCIVAVVGLAAWYFFLKPSGLISEPADAIPSNAFIIFESDSLSVFETHYFQSPQWTDLQNIVILQKFQQAVELLNNFISADEKLKDALRNEKIMAAAVPSGSGIVEYVFVAKIPGYRLHSLDWSYGESKAMAENYKSNKETIYTYSIADISIACAKANSMFIFSTSDVLVESAILQLKESTGVGSDAAFMEVYALSTKNNVADVFIHMNQFALYAGKLSKPEYYKSIQQLGNFTSWLALEFGFESNMITVNGYAASNAESNTVLSGYKQSESNFDETDNFLLRNVAYALQGNKAGGLFSEGSNVQAEWSSWIGTSYTYAVSQTYDTQVENKSYMIFEVLDNEIALTKLNILSDNAVSTYREYNIYAISSSDILQNVSGFNFNTDLVFVAVLQGYLIVSPSVNQLMSVIDAYMSQHTLKQDQEYNLLKAHVASTCNYSFYLNPALCGEMLRSLMISDSVSLDGMQKFNGILLRFSFAKEAHIASGAIRYNTEAKAASGFAWKTQIDYPVLSGPFAITNHISGKENIFLQDTSFQVYLISQDGNVEWKRKLNFPITNNVVTVDFYNNGKKQIVFAATDGIYMLDMLGRDVEGFPISVTTEVTSPLTVFDYEGKGDYRMFIGCGNGNVYGYYKDGKPLPGWSPLKKSGTIEFPFTYLQSNQKDYIAYSNTAGVISLKNRKGESRAQNVNADNALITPVVVDNTSSPKMLLAIDKKLQLLRIALEGKIESESIADDVRDAVLADINGDGNTDVVYISSTEVIAQTTDGEKIWNYPIGNTSDFKLLVYQGKKNCYVALVNPLIQKCFVINPAGTLADGFPIAADKPVIIIESGSLAVSALQNFVVAYNIK